MVIYMRHPVHGTKVAVDEKEAVADEANGWVRFDVNAIPAVEQSDVVKEVIKEGETTEREELTKQYQERFGKKPHWKTSLEKIREELCQPPTT